MALHIPDFVRVTIDGTDRTGYVVSYARHSTLCAFSDTFTLELSFEIPATPDPYDSIVINELYDGENEKILGGYIIDVVQSFDNGNYIISGQDKTLLLDDYFIHTQTIANNETVAYWMNYYAGLVGLSIQYDSSVTQFIVEEGTPMGMITASDGMSLLERLAAVYIKYDATIDKLRVFRFNTSEPVIQITNNETTKFDRERSTDKTRNVVKVYGAQRYNLFSGTTTRVTAKAVTNLDELVVDKTAVIANPHIRRVSTAQLIATRVLQIIDGVDDVLHIETAGFYPQVDVGDYMGLDIGATSFDYSADREVTSIQTTVDTNGVVTIFTVGEKCPRVSIMPPTTAVYATAENGGVLVSWDAGDSFQPFNKGIVSQVSEVGSGIDGTSIAANKYGQLMAVVDNSLYARTGKYGRWTDISAYLSGPSDDEGEHQFGVVDLELVKVEKDSGAWGRFHFLAKVTSSGGIVPSGQERWWAYWTPDFGYSWDSMQLYVLASGIVVGAPSGIPAGLTNGLGITHLQMQTAAALSGTLVFNVDAKDIEGGQGGNVTVLVEGEPKFYIPPETPDAETFVTAAIANPNFPATTTFVYGGIWGMDGYTNYWQIGIYPNEIASDVGYTHSLPFVDPLGGLGLFSVPNNREVAYFLTYNQFEDWHPIRTKGEYVYDPNYDMHEIDVPAWEHIAPSPGPGCSSITNIKSHAFNQYLFLYDYSSLKASTTTSRWVVFNGYSQEGPSATGTKPTGDTLRVGAVFFTDDIDIDAADSCTACTQYKFFGYDGGAGYDGEGLVGYEGVDPTTQVPVPRNFIIQHPPPGGADRSATTLSKSGNNKGYGAFAIKDVGTRYGDDRDDNCDPGDPGYPNCYPRDWGENVSVMMVVAELDFATEEISLVANHFNFAAYYEPDLLNYEITEDALRLDWRTNAQLLCKMINPNLIWVRSYWPTYGTYHEFWISYPSFTVIAVDYDVNADPLFDLNSRNGVAKVPYFGESLIATSATSRGPGNGDPPGEYTDTTKFYKRVVSSWEDISPPPVSPIGQVMNAKQNPHFGVCTTEAREVPSGSWLWYRPDYHFMWKAQRANPGSYTVMGSSDKFLDPYAEEPPPIGGPPAHTFTWDFRTAIGSYDLDLGGSSGVWNFVG